MWDRSKAIAALESFALEGTNASLAVYWLSLWDGDRPPARGAFDPTRVRDLLPAVALIEVRADGNAVCRLSGSVIDTALGGPLRGVNLVTLVDGDERWIRAQRAEAMVAGGVALSRTRHVSPGRPADFVDTIHLPFFGMQEDGSRQYLSHTNWRPRTTKMFARQAHLATATPDEYRAVALR